MEAWGSVGNKGVAFGAPRYKERGAEVALSIKPELLAPAGNETCLHAAVSAGADAVYLGLDEFNARRNADNFTLETLPGVCEYAHLRGVSIYVTMNIEILPSEFQRAIDLARGVGLDRGHADHENGDAGDRFHGEPAQLAVVETVTAQLCLVVIGLGHVNMIDKKTDGDERRQAGDQGGEKESVGGSKSRHARHPRELLAVIPDRPWNALDIGGPVAQDDGRRAEIVDQQAHGEEDQHHRAV